MITHNKRGISGPFWKSTERPGLKNQARRWLRHVSNLTDLVL